MHQFAGIRFTSFYTEKGIFMIRSLFTWTEQRSFSFLNPFSFVCRLEKQRKKLQREYLLKDLKDEKDEKLEKVIGQLFFFVNKGKFSF